MNIIETAIPGLLIIEPRVFGDERGFFTESWNAKSFAAAGSTSISCRTITAARRKACCAACITSRPARRGSWCA